MKKEDLLLIIPLIGLAVWFFDKDLIKNYTTLVIRVVEVIGIVWIVMWLFKKDNEV